jgi:hypothetical protein
MDESARLARATGMIRGRSSPDRVERVNDPRFVALTRSTRYG